MTASQDRAEGAPVTGGSARRGTSTPRPIQIPARLPALLPGLVHPVHDCVDLRYLRQVMSLLQVNRTEEDELVDLVDESSHAGNTRSWWADEKTREVGGRGKKRRQLADETR